MTRFSVCLCLVVVFVGHEVQSKRMFAKQPKTSVRIIFLDPHGSLLPADHDWKEADALNQPPYKTHADAFAEAVKTVETADLGVVKIIVTAPYWSQAKRFEWLKDQFKKHYGISVVGHTAVIKLEYLPSQTTSLYGAKHPTNDYEYKHIVKQDLVIKAVLESGKFGESGLADDDTCVESSFGENVEIAGWVAVSSEELDFDKSNYPYYYWGCMDLPGKEVTDGSYPKGTKSTPDYMRDWVSDKLKPHFVRVPRAMAASAGDGGIGPDFAKEVAIKLAVRDE